jgi:hypothetical protein
VQTEADQKPAVIIEEGNQVNPPVLPLEDEGEQIGLPELVGRGGWMLRDSGAGESL